MAAAASGPAATSGSGRSVEALQAEFRENGCLKLPNFLSAAALAQCQRLFDQAVTNPKKIGPRFFSKDAEGKPFFYNNATGQKLAVADFEALFAAFPVFARTCAEIWGSRNVWFYDHEAFNKTGGVDEGPKPTPFHQDLVGSSCEGEHLANIWIPLDAYTPKENSLEMLPGSHNGPLYITKAASAVVDESKENKRGGGSSRTVVTSGKKQDAAGNKPKAPRMPFMPEIPQDQLRSWDATRGDVVFLHPGCIHGGGSLSPAFPERNTLALRFFGDKCVYKQLPGFAGATGYKGVENGDHFSLAKNFPHLLGPGIERPEGHRDSAAVAPSRL